jgi:uncharacterized membrane protein
MREVRRGLGRAVVLGVVTGMRTQLPLALLAAQAKRGRFAADSAPPPTSLHSSAALPLLTISAAGEMVVDKLPIAPSRLAPGPLFGRFLFGGLAGALVARGAGQRILTGAVLGAGGAGVGAFAGYHVRVWLGETTGLPDPIWGALEDTLALALGLSSLVDSPVTRLD